MGGSIYAGLRVVFGMMVLAYLHFLCCFLLVLRKNLVVTIKVNIETITKAMMHSLQSLPSPTMSAMPITIMLTRMPSVPIISAWRLLIWYMAFLLSFL